MKTIFVVDDNDTNILAAKTALDGTYKVFALQSAARMFKLAEKITPDLILLDIEMPEMDGFEAMQMLKSDEKLQSIPVVFLTLKNDAETEVRGFEMGALDFITKHFIPAVLLSRIKVFLHMDEVIKKRTAKIEELKNGIITVMANVVESRDETTGGHIERTSTYLKIMLDAMMTQGVYASEIKNWNMNTVTFSARLHDVGKIRITDLILNKPGKLTPEEFEKMQTHCSEGERIISEMVAQTGEGPFLHHAKLFAGYHHEKWNGKGYPYGLRGEEIPLQGRIMAIADVYDALVSKRPYKKAFTHEQAVEIIKNDSGTHFDPQIVEVFVDVADDFAAVYVSKSLKKIENAIEESRQQNPPGYVV